MSAEPSLILAIEHVRSSYNVGSLFRTAAAAGVERIILSPMSPNPERTEVSKTALGGEKAVPWEQPLDFLRRLKELRAEGYALVAVEQTERSVNLFTAELPAKVVLILGHEREGVSQEALVLCNLHVEIPMAAGPVHSLNVATAGAIAMYEIRRRL